jgi:MFS family permease
MDLKQPHQKQPSPWQTIGLGTLAAVIGFYLVLAALSLLPSPGRPIGPMWVVLAVGFGFLLGGLWVLIPALVMDELRAEASPDTPERLHVAQYVFALAVVMCCAMVGSWIALGPGAHGSLPFSSNDSLDVLGRAIFAIGAVVIWLGLIAVAISGWRKCAGGCKASGGKASGGKA